MTLSKRQMIRYSTARAAAACIGLEISLPEDPERDPQSGFCITAECVQCEARCTVIIGLFGVKAVAAQRYRNGAVRRCLKGLDTLMMRAGMAVCRRSSDQELK